jgi:hypothetical protein
MRDFLDEFEKEVKEPLPQTRAMNVYSKSITQYQIKVDDEKGVYAYALASNPKPLELSKLREDNHVVYATAAFDTDALGMLLIENGPWVKNRLPENLSDVDGVRLVHREVTADEVAKVAKANDKVLKERARDFAEAGAKVTKKKNPIAPASVPDLMFQAIRMEFGIMGPSVPHWGRAYRKRMSILKRVLKDKKKYTKYIADPDFNGWTQTLERLKTVTAQGFNKRYGPFEKKITGG